MFDRSPLRQRDGPLPRCTASLRRASCGLQRAAGFRVCAQANAPARALSREEAQHKRFAACARRAALLGVSSRHKETYCASEVALYLGARPCSEVPVADSNEQPAFACSHTRTRQHALSLGRRRSIRACGACPLRRAGCDWIIFFNSPLRHRECPIPRRTAVLRRASRGLRRAAGVRVCAHANAPPRALSREEAQHARL